MEPRSNTLVDSEFQKLSDEDREFYLGMLKSEPQHSIQESPKTLINSQALPGDAFKSTEMPDYRTPEVIKTPSMYPDTVTEDIARRVFMMIKSDPSFLANILQHPSVCPSQTPVITMSGYTYDNNYAPLPGARETARGGKTTKSRFQQSLNMAGLDTATFDDEQTEYASIGMTNPDFNSVADNSNAKYEINKLNNDFNYEGISSNLSSQVSINNNNFNTGPSGNNGVNTNNTFDSNSVNNSNYNYNINSNGSYNTNNDNNSDNNNNDANNTNMDGKSALPLSSANNRTNGANTEGYSSKIVLSSTENLSNARINSKNYKNDIDEVIIVDDNESNRLRAKTSKLASNYTNNEDLSSAAVTITMTAEEFEKMIQQKVDQQINRFEKTVLNTIHAGLDSRVKSIENSVLQLSTIISNTDFSIDPTRQNQMSYMGTPMSISLQTPLQAYRQNHLNEYDRSFQISPYGPEANLNIGSNTSNGNNNNYNFSTLNTQHLQLEENHDKLTTKINYLEEKVKMAAARIRNSH